MVDAEVSRLTAISVAGRKPPRNAALKLEIAHVGSSPTDPDHFHKPKGLPATAVTVLRVWIPKGITWAAQT